MIGKDKVAYAGFIDGVRKKILVAIQKVGWLGKGDCRSILPPVPMAF